MVSFPHSFVPVAIPALQPIVHDLFVLRGTNKADAGKELETQKEVVVSMLLRLIQYHQVRGKYNFITDVERQTMALRPGVC